MTTIQRRPTGAGDVRGSEPELARASAPTALDRRVFVVAAVVFAVLMVLSPWYGFHRDELYFLDAGRHLQGGYVDQPAFAPLLARLSLALFGVSVVGLRLFPAVAAAATVTVAGLTARELAGSPRAQLLAAFAVATMPVLLAVDHLAGPTAFDVLAWAALAWLLLRLDRTRDERLWLAAGAVLGVGLANKHSIGLFAAALVLGVVMGSERRLLLSRWFVAGAVVALACTVPDLVWQAQHGWATVAMTRQLNHENGGLANIGSWVAGQTIMSAFALVPVWIAGLGWLWRSGRPLRRAIVSAYVLLFVLFAVTTGGKIYYLAGAYVPLLAAGAVRADIRLTASGRSARRLAILTAVTAAAAVPLVLPVLPASDIGWTYAINQVPAESVGWPELVRTVDQAWNSLPPSQQARTAILTANYGEAGAVTELGRPDGLPAAYGTQNSEWWWGPPPAQDDQALVIAPGPRDGTDYATYLSRFFARVTTVAELRNPAGLHNQEWGGHVYLCTGMRSNWSTLWPQLRHYD